MSNKANLEPFHLTPDGMYTIMGGLKIGGYRSAMQYLDLAKQEHIRLGHSSLAYRVCARSCKRGLGSAKQAAALPLERLREIGEDRCWVPAGPVQPVKSTIVASWWLLRELEASRSRVRHITVDFASRTVSRLLPSSKTDVAALGTTRRHSCSCSVLPAGLCPFHLVADLIKDKGPNEPVFTDLGGAPPSKAGWADTFQELARLLGIPTCWPNGARGAFTAIRHARLVPSIWHRTALSYGASRFSGGGARTPSLAQLAELAIESGHRDALARIRRDLESLLGQVRPLLWAIPDQSWLHEVGAVGKIRRSFPAPGFVRGQPEQFILNTARGGKIHRCLSDLNDPAVAFNPGSWRAYCL